MKRQKKVGFGFYGVRKLFENNLGRDVKDKYFGDRGGVEVQREKIFVSSWIVVVKQDLEKMETELS